MEKTTSGITRTKDPYVPKFRKQSIKKVYLPSLNTLKRNAQKIIEQNKDKQIYGYESIFEFIEYEYKTFFIENNQLKIKKEFKDFEIRKELTDLMRFLR